MKGSIKIRWPVLLLMPFVSSYAYAGSGNTLPRASAASIGAADANVVLSDGPSSQFINPANIASETAARWETGVALGQVNNEFDRPTAAATSAPGNFEAETGYPVIPFFAYSQPLGNAVFGVSFESTNGASSEWPDRTFQRSLGGDNVDITVSSELRTLRIGPTIALALNPQWSVGGRLFLQHVEAMERSDLSKVEGDGHAFGGQIGMRYTGDGYAFGAAYTSATKTEIEGELSDIHPLLAGTLIAGSATADILLPARLQAGVAFQLNPSTWWELDLDWIDWSYLDELTIVQSNGTIANAGRNTRHYENTLAWRTSVKWRQSEQVTYYAGFALDPTPVPERDVTPTQSFLEKTRLAFGTVRELNNGWQLGLAYQFIKYRDRHINASDQDNVISETNLFEGAYGGHSHVIGITLGGKW